MDKSVLQEVRNKNEEIFESIFKNYYHSLVKFSEGILLDQCMAEDEVQQLFVYLWENSERLDIKISIKSYLFQAVKNRSLNKLKSIDVNDKMLLHYKVGLSISHGLDFIEEEAGSNRMIGALEKLPVQQQAIARLKYLDGKKYNEIADMLGVSVNTVKTQLVRAKNKLRTNIL